MCTRIRLTVSDLPVIGSPLLSCMSRFIMITSTTSLAFLACSLNVFTSSEPPNF